MTLINTGTDSWVLEYNACEKLSREIMAQLHNRDKETPDTSAYNSLSGLTRVRLRQYQNELTQLRDKLQMYSVISTLTSDEKERRIRQVEALQSRLVQMEGHFASKPGSSTGRDVRVKMESAGWADDDDDDDTTEGASGTQHDNLRNAPVAQLRLQQAQLLRDQETGLEELSQVIARQKRIATVITEEVDDQNALLDDIADNMDRVDTRVRGETNMIKVVSRKDATCAYWVTIVLLMIIIIAVVAAPGR